MAKVQIKSEKITPFGGIFHVREFFSRFVAPIIDKVLGIRCTSFGYQYSEIVGSLASIFNSPETILMQTYDKTKADYGIFATYGKKGFNAEVGAKLGM